MLVLEAFRYGWLLGLGIFGSHLLLSGAVFIRAWSLPALLGALVMIAGGAI